MGCLKPWRHGLLVIGIVVALSALSRNLFFVELVTVIMVASWIYGYMRGWDDVCFICAIFKTRKNIGSMHETSKQ